MKYADRAKSIKSNLMKNVVSVDVHVSQYAKLVSELQEEVNMEIFDCFKNSLMARNLIDSLKSKVWLLVKIA